jgi:hypothetical protein
MKEEEERAGAGLDNELTALLLKWDLEDAAKALAKHGWKSVSRLKRFNSDMHMDELGLSSGTVCALEALLQTIHQFKISIRAENFSDMHLVMTENTSDVGGGRNVGNIVKGAWMSYSAVTIPITGVYRVEYRVASLSKGGCLRFEKEGGTPVYGGLSIPVTGGWQTWTTISHTVNLNAGSQVFAIKATDGGWNLNWFHITKV